MFVKQLQLTNDVSIDDIPVAIAKTQSSEVNPPDVPGETRSVTCGLATA